MIESFKKLRPFLLIVALLLVWLGLYSFKSMPKESSPAINIPFFTITAIYPWADSKSVEEQVVQKIEDKLPSVANISTFDSVSTNNVWALTVQFKRWTDENTAYNDLKSALDEEKASLPEWTNIVLKKTDLTDIPVYTFSIVWNYYPSILYDKVRNLEDELKRIPGVDHVDVVWKYIPEVKISFDYSKLKKYGLKITNLVGLINQSIEKKPVDKKQLNWLLYSFEVRSYDLSWSNEIAKLESFKKQLENIPLINQDWNILRLKDLANVSVTHPFYKKESYVDWKSAITYMVYKTSWTDILDLVERLKEFLKTKDSYFNKEGLKQVEIFSRTAEVNKTFRTFTSNFRQTSIIILIVIALFVWLKQAFWVFFAFPLVYLITFIYLKSVWYTFNSIVSFSLVLTLWIMVDNLIVIIEWFDEWRKKWMDKYEALWFSIKMYRKPLIAWNLTTIAMFFPLNFMLTGRIGEFMKYLPTTVDGTLVFSILVAFIFLPLILSYIYRNKKWDSKLDKISNSVSEIAPKTKDNKITTWFINLVKKSFKNPKKVIVWFWILFVVSLVAFWKFGKIDFMPATDKNNIYVNIAYDRTVSMNENKKLSDEIYNDVKSFFQKNYPWIVKNYSITIWDYQTFSPLDKVVYNNSFNPDLSKIDISLTDTDDRNEYQNAVNIYPRLNTYLNKKLPEFWWKVKEISVFIKKNGPSSWKDVSFNVSVKQGVKLWNKTEMDVLAQTYEKLLPELKNIPWTYSWSSSLEYTNWRISISYDMDKIKQFNLSLPDITTFLLSFYSSSWDYEWNGVKISQLSDVGKDIIPVVWFTTFSWDSFNLDSVVIPWTNVYLSQVVKKVTLNPEVKYYKHLDWKLVLNIQAYKTPDATLGPITTKINDIIWQDKNVELTYSSDVKDMKDSMKNLASAFIVWIFLMFAVLVLNFGNYKQPLIVFSTIPLLFIGAWWLLITFEIPFGFAAQLGMFGLIWVWVNNAILLIERYNELMLRKWRMNSEEWKDKELETKWDLWDSHTELVSVSSNLQLQSKNEILLETVKSRLKPVFLTTLTTILGLITLAIKDALWGSLALSFMWWLLVWTLITLIYIPAVLKVSKD